MQLINWPVIKEPLNWLIVLLMLVIAGFGFEVFIRFFKSNNSES